ncbi:MAG: hypothetical protein ACI9XO_003774 [Paraglaciecola sp.]
MKAWKTACDLPNSGYRNFGHIYTFEQNDMVFFYNPDIDEFVVFYDFTAEAGDSWRTTMPESDLQFEFGSFEVFVDSTSVVELAGQDLKALHVRYTIDDIGQTEYASTIVEYLGDLESMFAGYLDIATLCDGEYNRGFRCFENDAFGLVNFVDFPCDSTWLISSTNDVTKKDFMVTVYPNPTKTSFIVETTGKNASLAVYNYFGQKVHQQMTQTSIEINVADWQEGIYFIEVTNTETSQRKRKKIIVNR